MAGLPGGGGTRIWIAGVTDMGSGFNGNVFAFNGRRGNMIKALWWSGDVLCLLTKRLVDDFLPWNCAAQLPST